MPLGNPYWDQEGLFDEKKPTSKVSCYSPFKEQLGSEKGQERWHAPLFNPQIGAQRLHLRPQRLHEEEDLLL